MADHVMLDLETFSTAPDAAIVQVSACLFDLDPQPWTTGAVFERTVTLQSSILAGGNVDPETIEWWRRQSHQARTMISSHPEGTGTLVGALAAFVDWFPKGACLWSHGAAFDVPVLESALRSVGCAVPWDYRRVRDTRTLFELAEQLAGWSRPKRETAHTAAADARDQAEDVRSAHAALRAGIAFNEARGRLGDHPELGSATAEIFRLGLEAKGAGDDRSHGVLSYVHEIVCFARIRMDGGSPGPERRLPPRPTFAGRTINLNDAVRVTLTAAGAQAWRDRHSSEPPTYTNLQLPLWEVASTFGALLYNGSTQAPFSSMELEVVP